MGRMMRSMGIPAVWQGGWKPANAVAVTATAIMALFVGTAGADLIPSTISTNLTLTRDGNPWLLAANTIVKNGAILEVDEGVIVEATGNWKLETDSTTGGAIVVQGAPYDSVYFRAQAGGTASSLWQGLVISEGTGSSFDYMVVMNAKKGLNLNVSDAAITHCAVRYCDYGIWCRLSSPAVTSCWINDNGVGILCEGVSESAPNSQPVVFDSNIFDNAQYSVYLLNYYWGGAITIDMRGNWWGTSVEDEIRDAIFDSEDNPGGCCATVQYDPWRPQTPVEHRTWGSLKALFKE